MTCTKMRPSYDPSGVIFSSLTFNITSAGISADAILKTTIKMKELKITQLGS